MRTALLLVIALAACGGKKTAAKSPSSTAAPGGAGSAAQDMDKKAEQPANGPAPTGASSDPCMGGE